MVNPYYVQILYLQIFLLAKMYNLKINTQGAFEVICEHEPSGGNLEMPPTHVPSCRATRQALLWFQL